MSFDAAHEALRKYKRKPTLKQIKALRYIQGGMTKRQAMLKAGYSKGAAMNPGTRLMKTKGVQNSLMAFSKKLAEDGLTDTYMVKKFKEWLEAQRTVSALVVGGKGDSAKASTTDFIEVPDYKVQLEAYKEWKKIMDQQEEWSKSDGKGQMKRKLTIEEFITDEEIGKEILQGTDVEGS